MQASWTQLKQDFKLPDLFYLDLWPFGPEFIICAGADAAALPTTANSFPQADVVGEFFEHTVGKTFIEAASGPLWKELHQMLAPGLTPSFTKTYHHLIVDEAKMLYDQIRRLAISEQVTDLTFHLGKYPFSVIWQIFFGGRLEANSPLYKETKRLNDISGPTRTVLNPITKWQEKRDQAAIIRRLDREIKKNIRSRFLALQTEKPLPTKANASCLLDRMLLNQVQAGLPLDDRLMSLVQQK
jgi:cytochrome P450